MKWLIAIAVSLVIIFTVGFVVHSNFNDRQVVCTVVDKDRTTKSEGGSDMRIYTEECGNLVVADNLFRGQWNSSDIYREIEPGQRYEFTVIGYRVPFLSWFPNIIEVG